MSEVLIRSIAEHIRTMQRIINDPQYKDTSDEYDALCAAQQALMTQWEELTGRSSTQFTF